MKRNNYIILPLMPNFVLDFTNLCLILVWGRQKLTSSKEKSNSHRINESI